MSGIVIPGPVDADDPDPIPESRTGSRAQDLVFNEISTGLYTSGDFNFIKFGDLNNDNEYDIIFGAEDNGQDRTKTGLYAYTGNGGINWTNASTGLWRGNSWAGVALADADEDGYMEYYATDESHGTDNSSGIVAWEYRNNQWTASAAHVTTPLDSGTPFGVMLLNVSGDSRLDMVVANGSGMKYFENQGGNPVTWRDKSTGLPTTWMCTALDVADMNADGLKDIVFSDYNSGGNEHLYIQNTTGSFHWTSYSSNLDGPGAILGIELADVNNDTHMDIVFGCRGDGLRALLGNSGNTSGTDFLWTSSSSGLPTGQHYYDINVVDIDIDGDMDIVAPSYSNVGIRIYLGNGNTNPGMSMTWTQATNTNLTSTGRFMSVDCKDINGDGSPDIAGASWGSGVKVYLNNISLDITAPGGITDLAVTNVTTTTITVNWTAPADNGTDTLSGPVKAYDMRYSLNPINVGNWNSLSQVSNEPAPATPGTPQHHNLTGLAPGTLYYIAMRHWDERPNYSPLSNIAQGTTLGVPDTTPPASINDLAAVNPTNNTIDLTWTAPADNGTDAGSGPVSEYDIRYHTATITTGNFDTVIKATALISPSTPGMTEQYSISGLAGNTTYYFAVKARDEKNNWGLLSNIATGKTLVDPDVTAPFGVNDLSALEPTNNSINLTWTAVGDDGNVGQAALYDIRYFTASITLVNWDSAVQAAGEPAPQAAGNTEHFTVAGLEPDTTYYFGIMVRDEMLHWSPLSNIAFNTTLSDLNPDVTPPVRITDLAATDPTTTTLTLTWTAPGDDSDTGQAESYDIRYSTSMIGDANWDAASAVTSPPTPKAAGQPEIFIVTDLDLETTYFFAVKTEDDAGLWSELSNIAFGTTLDDTEPPQVLPELTVQLAADKSTLNSSESIEMNVLVRALATMSPVAQVTVNSSSTNSEVVIDPASIKTASNGAGVIILGAPVVSVTTNFTVDVEVSKAGFSANASSMTFMVMPSAVELKFDLRITDSDITLNSSDITDGDQVTIYANISNTGDRYSTAFDVRFYVDGIQIGADSSIVILRMNDFVIVEIEWTAEEGVHTIKVDVIPSDSTLESDLSDNSGEREITVEKKIVPNGPDGPGPDDEEEAEKAGSSNVFAYMLMSLIVVIVVIILLFFIMRRRKVEYEYPLPPPPLPPPPPAGEMRVEMEEGGTVPTGEMREYTGEPIEPLGEAIEYIPPMAEPVLSEEMVNLPGETENVKQETLAEAEPTEQPPQEQPPQQMIPCPTCGNQIVAYSTPCPHCSTTLNWG